MNSKKIQPIYGKVNCESCIACGICQLKASKLFEYDTDGIAFMKHDNNTGGLPIPEQKPLKRPILIAQQEPLNVKTLLFSLL